MGDHIAIDDRLLIGRRTLLDRQLAPAAYTLIYHDAGADAESDLAGARLAANAFLEQGLERLTGSLPAFLSVNRALVTGRVVLPPAPPNIGVEVSAGSLTDPALAEGILALKADGYAVMLHVDIPDVDERTLALADWVRLDYPRLGGDALHALAETLAARDFPVAAGNLPDYAAFERCMASACALFDGPFLTAPRLITRTPLPANRAVAMELVARLEDPTCGIADLDDLIAQDATLAYRLMRYVNCAGVGIHREVHSIRETIVMLGARTVRNLATLLVMAQLDHPASRPLLVLSLVRARMCEQVAEQTGLAEPTAAFTTGLLSLMDALMERPMVELLDSLPVAAEIRLALLDRDGGLGELLEIAVGFERGDWPGLTAHVSHPTLHSETYVNAILWAEDNYALLATL